MESETRALDTEGANQWEKRVVGGWDAGGSERLGAGASGLFGSAL